MLPLWLEPERLILGDKAMTLNRRGQQHSISLPFESPERIDFDALAASLPVPMQKLAGRKINIILSNCWVRYLVLPWHQHVYAYKDWLALAQNRMREQYGARAAGWDIQISTQGYAKPVLAVATDRQIAEGLDRLADQHRWHLQQIEPAFATLVNRYPRHWHGDSWLLMADNNHLLLAESKAGIWQRFSLMLSSTQMMQQHALMLVQQARQFNPETRKHRLFLWRSGVCPKEDFIEDMDVRLLAADWLKTENEAGQQ